MLNLDQLPSVFFDEIQNWYRGGRPIKTSSTHATNTLIPGQTFQIIAKGSY